jgi:hypothetical protein
LFWANFKAVIEAINIVVQVYRFLDNQISEAIFLASIKRRKEIVRRYAAETEDFLRAEILKEYQDKINEKV